MTMTFWIIVGLALYMAAILAIGFISGRGAGRDAESFFVADRRMNWLQESMAIFTTAAPASALLGTIGLFYASGANMLGYVIGYMLITPVAYWLLGSKLRRIGAVKKYQTQADFIGEFYGSKFLRYGVSITGMIFMIPYFSTNPVALGLLLDQYTGFPYWAGVAVFVVVSAAYCMKGGLRAVADTDIFHGVLLIAFFVIVLYVLITGAGGFDKITHLPSATIVTSGPGLTLFLTWVLYNGLNPIVWPDRSLRMYSVKNDWNLRTGAVMTGAMLGFAAVCYLLIGLSARIIAPDIAKTDTTLATVLQISAAWLIPFFVVNAWGGGMSNFSAGMLSTANIFVKDLYGPYMKKRHPEGSRQLEDRHTVKVARIVMAVLSIATLYACFQRPPFLWSLINITLGFFLQLTPMLLLGIYWSKATRRAAEIGWVTGVALLLLWTFVLSAPLGIVPGFAALIVNTLVFCGVSLMFPESAAEQQRRDAIRALGRSETPDPVATPSGVKSLA